MDTENNADKYLAGFAITFSIIFGGLSCYVHVGRTLGFSKELVKRIHSTPRKWLAFTVALVNFIYSIIYAEGYKYIKIEIIKLVRPISYHLLVYILINGIASIFMIIGIFSKRIFVINIYISYVIQWIGLILILSNEIMFTSYPANIALAVILLLFVTPLVFLIPESLKIENLKLDRTQDNHELTVPLNQKGEE